MQRTEGSASVVTTGGALSPCSRAGLCRVFGTRLKRTGRGRQVLADVRSLQSNASPDMKRRAFLRLVGVAASRQPMRRGVPRPRSLRRPASADSSAGATASRRARQTRTTSCRGGPCPRIGSALPLRRVAPAGVRGAQGGGAAIPAQDRGCVAHPPPAENGLAAFGQVHLDRCRGRGDEPGRCELRRHRRLWRASEGRTAKSIKHAVGGHARIDPSQCAMRSTASRSPALRCRLQFDRLHRHSVASPLNGGACALIFHV